MPRALMANQPYYQIRSLTATSQEALLRALWVPVDPVDQSYSNYDSPISLGGSRYTTTGVPSPYAFNDGFYILVAGARPTLTAIRVRITLVYQFHPLDVVSPIVSQEVAGPGTCTRLA